uniref:WNK lysine deficient protein kinase 2 n=1 Tax=Mandrillus leucophaeus TaxID=9568 RepID=A0A2K6A3Y5_MANLE
MEQGTSSSMTEASPKSMLGYDRDGGQVASDSRVVPSAPQDVPAFVRPTRVEPTDRDGGVAGESSAEPPQSGVGISTAGGQASHPQTLGARGEDRKEPKNRKVDAGRAMESRGNWGLCRRGDSGDEGPRARPPVQKQASLPGSGSVAGDFVKKATAFLQRPSRAGSLGPETPSRAGMKVPTISVTSFHSQSSYISSDNDSELEDADIKKELQSLREKHLKEISELQSQQKQEIEALYRRLGKPLPPNVGFFHTAPPTGRRRKTSKSKLKAGKLLNPLVRQLKVVASSTGHLADSSRGPPPVRGSLQTARA